jgi:hypothetical protein
MLNTSGLELRESYYGGVLDKLPEQRSASPASLSYRGRRHVARRPKRSSSRSAPPPGLARQIRFLRAVRRWRVCHSPPEASRSETAASRPRKPRHRLPTGRCLREHQAEFTQARTRFGDDGFIIDRHDSDIFTRYERSILKIEHRADTTPLSS